MENNTPNTNNFLNWVEIKNFKSIKDLRLDCKRVNVFIGKPNVGKSNILEGLGLLGGSYDRHDPILRRLIRFKSFSNIFYDDDFSSAVRVKSDKLEAAVSYDWLYKRYYLVIGQQSWLDQIDEAIKTFRSAMSPEILKEDAFYSMMDFLYPESEDKSLSIEKHDYEGVRMFRFSINESGRHAAGAVNKRDLHNPIKFYKFRDGVKYNVLGDNYLSPPYGENLFAVVNHDGQLRKDIADLFRDNSLEFVLNKKEKIFSVQKRIDGYIYNYPYSSIADTFQRFVFYTAAIESNKNSVLVFEEPEVHSFPPYVKALAHRMVYSETNQFFVSTHSPYLLQTLIDELDKSELAVYITYYKDYQTHVHQLTANELQEARDLSIDLFYNLSRYEPNA